MDKETTGYPALTLSSVSSSSYKHNNGAEVKRNKMTRERKCCAPPYHMEAETARIRLVKVADADIVFRHGHGKLLVDINIARVVTAIAAVFRGRRRRGRKRGHIRSRVVHDLRHKVGKIERDRRSGGIVVIGSLFLVHFLLQVPVPSHAKHSQVLVVRLVVRGKVETTFAQAEVSNAVDDHLLSGEGKVIANDQNTRLKLKKSRKEKKQRKA
jgi:hypothetical protein